MPVLLILLPLWVFLCRPGKVCLSIMLLLTVIDAAVVNVDIMDKKYSGGFAAAVEMGFHLRHGVVVADIEDREHFQSYFEPKYVHGDRDPVDE